MTRKNNHINSSNITINYKQMLRTAIFAGGPVLSVRKAKHKACGKLSSTTQSCRERPPGLEGEPPGSSG